MNLFRTAPTIHTRRAAQWRRIWADPLTVRQWHNPADEHQSDAIEAAKLKRYRKARKYADNMSRSEFYNEAHGGIPFAHTLNPFYIAK